MMDGRMGLELVQTVDPDRAGLANAAEIVALEVDDHQELRPVLFAREKLAAQALVVPGRISPGAGALDGARFQAAVLDPQKALGRTAHHLDRSAVEIARERGRA